MESRWSLDGVRTFPVCLAESLYLLSGDGVGLAVAEDEQLAVADELGRPFPGPSLKDTPLRVACRDPVFGQGVINCVLSKHGVELGYDLLLQFYEFGGELLLGLLEDGYVKPHTGLLHFTKHFHQRQLDLVVQVPQGTVGLQLIPLGRDIRVVGLFGIEQISAQAGFDVVALISQTWLILRCSRPPTAC